MAEFPSFFEEVGGRVGIRPVRELDRGMYPAPWFGSRSPQQPAVGQFEEVVLLDGPIDDSQGGWSDDIGDDEIRMFERVLRHCAPADVIAT